MRNPIYLCADAAAADLSRVNYAILKEEDDAADAAVADAAALAPFRVTAAGF